MPSSEARPQGLELLDREHLEFLLGASQEFNSALELEELVPRILSLTLELLDGEAGSLWLRDGNTLRCNVAVGPVSERIEGIEIPVGAGVVGDVVARKQAERVDRPDQDSRFLHQVDEATGFETIGMLTVPLMHMDDCLGAIQLVNKRTEDGDFSEQDLHFLCALADDAAAALRNARLFEAERKAHDLAALLKVSHEITSSFDLEQVLVSVVNLGGQAVRFDRCVLAMEEAGTLKVRAISGEDTVDRRSAAVREVEKLLLWVAEGHHEELYVADLEDPDDELAEKVRESFPAYVESSHARSLLVVEISDAESSMGLLLFEFGEAHVLEPWGRKAAELLADQAALSIRNAQLYQDVPFISVLEPLAERWKSLARVPGSTWLKWGGAAAALILLLTFVRIPLWVSGETASVRAANQVPARAGVDGVVQAVWVEEGDRVQAGAPMADLRNEDLLRRVRNTEAELDQARRRALAADARGAAAEAALARVRVAELEDALALLQSEAGRSRVVTPVAGVILTPRMAERVGDFVPAGGAVAWVGDSEWVELEVQIGQDDLGLVELDDPVRAKVAAHPSVIFEGRVTEVAPRAGGTPDDPTYTVRAILDNREGLLRPGMVASAKIVTSSRPLGAILFRRPWLWIRMHLWW